MQKHVFCIGYLQPWRPGTYAKQEFPRGYLQPLRPKPYAKHGFRVYFRPPAVWCRPRSSQILRWRDENLPMNKGCGLGDGCLPRSSVFQPSGAFMVYLMVACLIVSFVALHLMLFCLPLPDQERHLPSALRT